MDGRPGERLGDLNFHVKAKKWGFRSVLVGRIFLLERKSLDIFPRKLFKLNFLPCRVKARYHRNA